MRRSQKKEGQQSEGYKEWLRISSWKNALGGNLSELKCCKLCGAFLTCDHKGECCPECTYFDPQDILCMAPDALKKAKNKEVAVNRFDDDEVDPQTFLFEDDDDAEEEADTADTLDAEDEWG